MHFLKKAARKRLREKECAKKVPEKSARKKCRKTGISTGKTGISSGKTGKTFNTLNKPTVKNDCWFFLWRKT